MGQLVYAAATSHVGAILKNPDADPERSARLNSGWATMDAELAAADLDALVIVGTDHYETFGLDNYPTFCLGMNEELDGWGEFGSARMTAAGAPDVARELYDGLLAAGFDVSRSHTMRLDHSFMTPLVRVPAAGASRIVPLFVNCTTAPLPSMRRCFQLGEALAKVGSTLRACARIGVLATGGVSHWVGLPRFGDINEDFDREFLRMLSEARYEQMLDWTDSWIEQTAGNGALELRNWMVAAGAAHAMVATVHAYEPMYPWATGIGVVGFKLGEV
jgi:aromatic ring-opening dioxygenase catalytic subunit (LigB family)